MPATPSLIKQPDYLSPVNAEMWYVVDSASSSTTDFKYIFDVYEIGIASGITASFYGRFKVPPRPGDGYGPFSVNKIIKAQFDKEGVEILTPTITSIVALQNYERYSLKYGFEFNPNQEYIDFVNVPSFGIASTSPVGAQVGDILTINKGDKSVNTSYDGTHSVTSAPTGATSIPGITGSVYFTGLSGTFGESTPVGTDYGLITNLTRVSGTVSPRIGYNGTRQYNELNKNFTDYLMSTATMSFLTSYGETSSTFPSSSPRYKTIGAYDWETVNYFTEIYTVPTANSYRMVTFDAAGNGLGLYTATMSTGQPYKEFAMPTGTNNIRNIFGATALDNVSKYIVGISNPFSGEFAYRQIVSGCNPYTPTRLAFLTRAGGFDYWTFNKDNKRTVNVERSEYKKVLDYDYSFGDRGVTTLAQNVSYVYTLQSDWINEYDYSFLEELITSPDVFIVETDGTLTPINITDTSYTIKTMLRDTLFNFTINYKLSYGINVQNQ